MVKNLRLCLLLALVVPIIFQCSREASEPAVEQVKAPPVLYGLVNLIIGEAALLNPQMQEWKTLRVGMKVHDKEIVKTGPASKINFKIVNTIIPRISNKDFSKRDYKRHI